MLKILVVLLIVAVAAVVVARTLRGRSTHAVDGHRTDPSARAAKAATDAAIIQRQGGQGAGQGGVGGGTGI